MKEVGHKKNTYCMIHLCKCPEWAILGTESRGVLGLNVGEVGGRVVLRGNGECVLTGMGFLSGVINVF